MKLDNIIKETFNAQVSELNVSTHGSEEMFENICRQFDKRQNNILFKVINKFKSLALTINLKSLIEVTVIVLVLLVIPPAIYHYRYSGMKSTNIKTNNNAVNSNPYNAVTLDEIDSIKVVPPRSGIVPRHELYFDLNNKKQRDTASDIIKWLHSAQIVGDAKDEFPLHGGSPANLTIVLKNGTSIEIKSAKGSTTTNLSDGKLIQGIKLDGQVTVYDSNLQVNFREKAPELKAFMENGWQQLFNYHETSVVK